MKKIVLNICLAGILLLGAESCSKKDEVKSPIETKNDDKGGDGKQTSKVTSEVTFLFGGKPILLDKVNVTKQKGMRLITAYKGNIEDSHKLSFLLKEGVTGADITSNFIFTTNTNTVYFGDGTMDVIFHENNADKIQAVLGGVLKTEQGDEVIVKSGVINIKLK